MMTKIITIEGGEYTGKSTLAQALYEKFIKRKYVVYLGGEPGGTKKAIQIRKKIFKLRQISNSPKQLAILFNQARSHHVKEKLLPFIKKNVNRKSLIILDRYIDSTRVYQGLETGFPLSYIYKLEQRYIYNLMPHYTFILYFPLLKFKNAFLKRQKSAKTFYNKEITQWDNDLLEIHKKRQEYFLTLKKLSENNNEDREIFFIDASKSTKEMVDNCVNIISPML